MKYKCPCCGFYTFYERPNGNYNICPVCFWEDDLTQLNDENLSGGANKVSLAQGRRNFLELGACEKEKVQYVREPADDELNGID